MIDRRRRIPRWTLPAVLAIGVSTGAAIAVAPTAAAETVADSDWKVVYGSAELGGQYRALAVGDSTHAWAFGNTNALNPERTRIDRFDGDGWHPATVPADATVTPTLADASGPSDVWAGGLDDSGDFAMLHFDGRQWSDAAVTTGGGKVADVEAVASDDVWLVSTDQSSAVATRFDGEAWHEAPAPAHYARALTSLSADRLYAAGSDGRQPTVERFDGQEWTSMAVPPVELGGCEGAAFEDVFARAADDVWAAGIVDCMGGDDAYQKSLVAHWDGTDWKVTVGDRGGVYTQVADDGAGGVWLADYYDYVHIAANGTTTRHTVASGNAQTPTIENLPGTTGMVGTVSFYEDGDPPQPRNFGAVMTYDG